MPARSEVPEPDAAGPAPSGPPEVAARLVARARAGDAGAFAKVVEHWDPDLRRFVHLVLGAEDESERILAAAYVRAYRALPRYRDGNAPGLWLHRVAYLTATDHLRRASRQASRRKPVEPTSTGAVSPTDDVERAESLPWVTSDEPAPLPEVVTEPVAVLRRLGPDQRALAVLLDLAGFDPAAVADAFDTPPAVVTARHAAARSALLEVAPPDPSPPEPTETAEESADADGTDGTDGTDGAGELDPSSADGSADGSGDDASESHVTTTEPSPAAADDPVDPPRSEAPEREPEADATATTPDDGLVQADEPSGEPDAPADPAGQDQDHPRPEVDTERDPADTTNPGGTAEEADGDGDGDGPRDPDAVLEEPAWVLEAGDPPAELRQPRAERAADPTAAGSPRRPKARPAEARPAPGEPGSGADRTDGEGGVAPPAARPRSGDRPSRGPKGTNPETGRYPNSENGTNARSASNAESEADNGGPARPIPDSRARPRPRPRPAPTKAGTGTGSGSQNSGPRPEAKAETLPPDEDAAPSTASPRNRPKAKQRGGVKPPGAGSPKAKARAEAKAKAKAAAEAKDEAKAKDEARAKAKAAAEAKAEAQAQAEDEAAAQATADAEAAAQARADAEEAAQAVTLAEAKAKTTAKAGPEGAAPDRPGPEGSAQSSRSKPGIDADVGQVNPEDEAAARRRIGALLATIEVPTATPRFWADLGRRLLTERAQPAPLSIDPVARLAGAHPAAPGFQPAAGAPKAVATIADRAGRPRPLQRWRRALTALGVAAVVLAAVAGALVFGTSDRPPDGTRTGRELALMVIDSLDTETNLAVDVTIESDGAAREAVRLVLAADGSWSYSRIDTIDISTYDMTGGEARTLVVGADPSGEASLVGTLTAGLGSGPPDLAATVPPILDDLAAVVPVLVDADAVRGRPDQTDDQPSWTLERRLPTGPNGSEETWAISIDRLNGFPLAIERRRGEEVVRSTTFAGWTEVTDVGAEAFSTPFPDGIAPSLTAGPFVASEPGATDALVGRQAPVPGWLPAGFELVAVRVAPTGADGAPTTGGGTNPPDLAVISVAYQRGPQRLVLTTRVAGDETAWRDPFTDGVGAPRRRQLGDGLLNGTQANVGTDGAGRARLWLVDDGLVFTVAGDITAEEAVRVAASLR